jgi:hypothetical protein
MRLFVSIIAILTLLGCASSPTLAVSEKLDPNTGVTVTFSRTPMVLYRDTPSQAAYARNYLHLGPIQVNRAGTYRYYLCVGIWNTMQVADISEHRDGFESIIVFADGEPLTLELVGWTPKSIGTSEPTYVKPVASTADAYYEVTADQIRLIAHATDIRVQATGTSPKEFQLWDEQVSARNSLAEFLNRTFF